MLKVNGILHYLLAGAIMASPLAGTAFAEEVAEDVAASSEEILTTNSVIVTAGKKVQDILDVQYSVDVITAEEVERTVVTRFADLLKDIPGVFVTTSGGEYDRVSIRGEGSGETLVLIDGVKTSSVFHGHGGELAIDPSIIESIEVIKGPATVLYGAEALGGVINIITKKGGTEPIQGEFRTAYSSSSLSFVNTMSVFGDYEGFSYRLMGSYDDYGDYQYGDERKADSGGIRWDVNSYLSYDFTDKLTVGFGYERFDRQVEYGATLSDESVYATDRFTLDATYKDISPYLAQVKAVGFYYVNDHDYLNSTHTYDTSIEIKNTGFNIQSDWTLGDSTYLIAGYDYLREEYDYLRYYYASPTLNIREAEQNTHAVFAAVEHSLPADFTLSYGARYVYMNTELGTYYNVDSTGAVTSDQGTLGGSESDVVFNVGLVWTGVDNLALRALWSQGYRPPSFYNKYMDIPSASGGFLHNEDLLPEESDNFEIGARYADGAFTADIATYYTKSKNRLSSRSVVVDGNSYTQWYSAYKTDTMGLEASLSYKVGYGLEPYISASWMRRQEISAAGERENIDTLPSLTGTIGLRYNDKLDSFYNVKVNADLYVRYQGQVEFESYVFNSSTYSYDIVDVVNDPWATVNLSFGAEWGENYDYFAQIELLNLTNKDYYYTTGTEYQPGFNANFVLGYRF